MIEAYKKYWKNYANFTDRSSRSDYWWSVLANVLFSLPFVIYIASAVFTAFSKIMPYFQVDGSTFLSEEELGRMMLLELLTPVNIFVWTAMILFSLAIFIPNLAIIVRRLRDAGFHGAFIFINFVPYIGPIVLIILLCQKSKPLEVFEAEDVI